jgi:hypothetical protein
LSCEVQKMTVSSFQIMMVIYGRNFCFWFSPVINSEDSIMLSHFRLGHPNLVYLENLFPTLFNKKPRKMGSLNVKQIILCLSSTHWKER